MDNIKINLLNLETDIPIIASWQKEYKNSPKFESINRFILEDNIFYNLDEVILTNYEIFPIGDNERKYAFSINDNDNLVGFILALVYDLQNSPELMIQYVVIHPEYQNKGIGTKALKSLIENPKQYFNTNITNVFAKIDYSNNASLKTFQKLGFSFNPTSSKFVAAEYKTLENINE